MTTLIIADLHLNEQEPAITAGFLRFLREQAVHASQLYILGDFLITGLVMMTRTRCIKPWLMR